MDTPFEENYKKQIDFQYSHTRAQESWTQNDGVKN